MTSIEDITKSLQDISDKKGISFSKAKRKWQKAAQQRLILLAETLNSGSPFKYKITKKDIRFSRNGVKNSYAFGELIAYSTRPNAGRIRGFSAPINKFNETDKVQKFLDDGRWLSTHKIQEKSEEPGVGYTFAGSSIDDGDRPQFFGLKDGNSVEAYGASYGLYGYTAIPIWSSMTFLDWLINAHPDQVEAAIIDTGIETLDEISA